MQHVIVALTWVLCATHTHTCNHRFAVLCYAAVSMAVAMAGLCVVSHAEAPRATLASRAERRRDSGTHTTRSNTFLKKNII